MMQLSNTPISSFFINGREIFIKRDDLLHPEFSGNKARKLAYFLEKDFSHIITLISYGGVQSNLMYSLSALAKLKGWQFIYYSNRVSARAKLAEYGNLAESIRNGMQLIELSEKNLNEYVKIRHTSNFELIIEQGAAQAEAKFGITKLADELREWVQENNIKKPILFLPSGTGATAFYLQNALEEYDVYTTNCVGSSQYLQEQWSALGKSSKLPKVLDNNLYTFAKPYLELWQTYNYIKELAGVEFDLIYDPIGWKMLLQDLSNLDGTVIYIHCGGLLGNSTMQERYYFSYPQLKNIG
ncbi:MAG: hypothetical protein PHC75_05530 [Burkholderiales bacterium]|nr:hypothetical protein [Burkholderiales bacterium]